MAYPIEITDKIGVVLDEYKNKYTLKKMSKGTNGNWYPEWVFLSEWKDGGPVPGDKKRPMGTYLGDKETALRVISALYHELNGDSNPNTPDRKPKEEPVKLPPVDESDIPF